MSDAAVQEGGNGVWEVHRVGQWELLRGISEDRHQIVCVSLKIITLITLWVMDFRSRGEAGRLAGR